MTSGRVIQIDGIENFRDIGGYTTLDGRVVKKGLLFRSAKPDHITTAGIDELKRIGIKTIVDFRSNTAERGKEVLDKDFRLINIPISHGNQVTIKKELESGKMDGITAHEYMKKLNKELVLNHTKQFSAFFTLLLEANNLPLMFHCTAGKDRTGFASAMFLSLMDVSRETVIEDYLLTNGHLTRMKKEYEHIQLSTEISNALQAVLKADKAYILTAFNAIDEQYGSVAEYFREGLHFSKAQIEQLKINFLD